jgi:taurine dioxygenase
MPNLRPLSDALGVEVTGVDISRPLAEEDRRSLRAAFLRYQLLHFRDVLLSAEQQIDFVTALDIAPVLDEKGTGHRYTWVTNTTEPEAVDPSEVIDGTATQLLWHADFEFGIPGPIRLISLYATDDNESSDPTAFCNMVRAAEGIGPELRRRMEPLRVLKAKDFTRSKNPRYDARNRVSEGLGGDSAFYHSEHPLLERHPITGAEVLTPSHMMTSHVVGWSDAESDCLFGELDAVAYIPENTYVHEWHRRDLLVWDNFALQHARGVTAHSAKRVLRRVTADPLSLQERMEQLPVVAV